jgi:hypothetical protein
MIDRTEIARRHGIPELAGQLHGDTREEVEAFAAAVAALRHQDEPINVAELAGLRAVEEKQQRLRQALGFEERGEDQQ